MWAMVRQLALPCTILNIRRNACQSVFSGKNPVQVPAAAWLVFTKGPESAAVAIAYDEVVAAAIAAIPPAAFDALGTCENFVLANIAAFGPGQ